MMKLINTKRISFILILFLASMMSCVNSEKNNKLNAKSTDTKEVSDFKIELSSADSAKLADFWKTVAQNHLQEKSIPEILIKTAEWFMGTPYFGGTLDVNDEEKLIVNLQGLDCVTFVENVYALGMSVKSGNLVNEEFFKNLQNIRYRNGKIDGYISRLHYFTEWMLDNQKKGIITIVSEKFGDKDFNANVNFISQHPQYYKQLSDTNVISEIKKIEGKISEVKLKMVSKGHVEDVENFIKDGNLIAIATSFDGLDVTHVGIAKHYNGRLHFIHASSKFKKVVLSEKSLSEYLKGIKKDVGILVAELN